MKEALCPKAWDPASPATSLQVQDWLFLCDVSFRRENQSHLPGRTPVIGTEAGERVVWMAMGSG